MRGQIPKSSIRTCAARFWKRLGIGFAGIWSKLIETLKLLKLSDEMVDLVAAVSCNVGLFTNKGGRLLFILQVVHAPTYSNCSSLQKFFWRCIICFILLNLDLLKFDILLSSQIHKKSQIVKKGKRFDVLINKGLLNTMFLEKSRVHLRSWRWEQLLQDQLTSSQHLCR